VETRANYVLVGSSVLAAIAAVIIFVFWLGRRPVEQARGCLVTPTSPDR